MLALNTDRIFFNVDVLDRSLMGISVEVSFDGFRDNKPTLVLGVWRGYAFYRVPF